MERLRVFYLSIAAGLSIAFGSATYIACAYYNNRILGSILFSVGLLIICGFGLKLYTGQVGKLFDNKKSFAIDLLVILGGNFIGAMGAGLLASLIDLNEQYQAVVTSVGESKLVDFAGGTASWYSIFIPAIFCGMLVYFAVEIYKLGKDPATKVLGLVLSVTAFVVSGFHHCIANMYYLGVSQMFIKHFWGTMLSLLIAVIGNSVGAIILNFLFKYGFKKPEEKKEELNN